MHRALAGNLSLQDMISRTIESSRAKIASAESAEKVVEPVEEKKASAPDIDPTNLDEVQKLASALIEVGEKIASNQINLGGESAQGGMVLQVGAKVPGKQSNKKDGSKKHSIQMNPGTKTPGDNPGASTAMADNEGKAPGGPAYPAKGVLKTASQTVAERILAVQQKHAAAKTEKKEEPAAAEAPKTEEVKTEEPKKEASALDYILGKVAESAQGGLTLDSKSGDGPKPPSDSKGGNDARKLIESNTAATNAKKVQAKTPQKRMLSEVLTEPAQTKSTDGKVQENLRNAAKGGVKIAAAKALLQKIAEAGCKCDGAGTCQYCKLKAAKAKMAEAKAPTHTEAK